MRRRLLATFSAVLDMLRLVRQLQHSSTGVQKVVAFIFTCTDYMLGRMEALRAQLASASRIFTYRLWKSSARSREPGDAKLSGLSVNTLEGSIS